MLRTGRKLPALALVVALPFAGCSTGEGGTIPPGDADELLAKVQGVQESIDQRNCAATETDIAQLKSAVDLLPKQVGADTKGDLFELVDNLEALVEDRCGQPGPTTPDEPDTGISGDEGVVPGEGG